MKGLSLTHSGYPAEGRESLFVALRHDLRTMDGLLPALIAMGYYFERNYETAVDILRRTLANNPTHPPGLRWMVAALGQLGRMDEAREMLRTAMTITPEAFRQYTTSRGPWLRPGNFEHMLDGLRKAGWRG